MPAKTTQSKVNEYLFQDKPASLYERLAKAEDARVPVFGHTHKPWVDTYGGVLYVNCGSVGKPKDGDPRAAFAILELDEANQPLTSAANPRAQTQPAGCGPR